MSSAHEYADLHGLVDQLTPGQARAVRAVVLELVGEPPAPKRSVDAMLADEPVRTFSFAGLIHAGPDLAEQSEDILRAEFGRSSE